MGAGIVDSPISNANILQIAASSQDPSWPDGIGFSEDSPISFVFGTPVRVLKYQMYWQNFYKEKKYLLIGGFHMSVFQGRL